ncbi:MAG: hypothetical protein R3F51_16720 [Cyanobacteriota/Melainabacteria group bacterium]
MKAILKVASFQTGLFLIWVFIALMAVITWFAIGMVMAIVGGDHFDSALFFSTAVLCILVLAPLLKANTFLIRYGLKDINRTVILINIVCFMTFMGMFFALPRH